MDVEWGNRRGKRLLLLLERRVVVIASVVIVRGLGLLGAIVDGFCIINWGLGCIVGLFSNEMKRRKF